MGVPGKWKPSAVVVSVFMAGVISLWVVISIRVVYDVRLDARDAVTSAVLFMTAAGWWTDIMRKKPPE